MPDGRAASSFPGRPAAAGTYDPDGERRCGTERLLRRHAVERRRGMSSSSSDASATVSGVSPATQSAKVFFFI
jgi:hypothetical protein